MRKLILSVVSLFVLAAPVASSAATNKLLGRILLQVQAAGEAWYVSPVTKQRIYLPNGDAAFQLLRTEGLGIKSIDLSLIPIGLDAGVVELDTDNDGLDNALERAIGTDQTKADSDGDGHTDFVELQAGYDPQNPQLGAKIKTDMALAKRLAGRILINADRNGQAWYVNPVNLKRYYLSNGNAALSIMRKFGLGITNTDLALVPKKGDVPGVSGQKTIDCAGNLNCFIAAAENNCQSAKLAYVLAEPHPWIEKNYPGLSTIATSTYYEIKGRENGSCLFYEKFVNGEMKYNETRLAEVVAGNRDLQSPTNRVISTTNENYKAMAGKDGTCKLTPMEFKSKLDATAAGGISIGFSINLTTGEGKSLDNNQCSGALYKVNANNGLDDADWIHTSEVVVEKVTGSIADEIKTAFEKFRQGFMTKDVALLKSNATPSTAESITDNIETVKDIQFEFVTKIDDTHYEVNYIVETDLGKMNGLVDYTKIDNVWKFYDVR